MDYICNRRKDPIPDDQVTLAKLVGDWLVEKGLDKKWKITAGHPHHILCYQKLVKGGHPIPISDLDGTVTGEISWSNPGGKYDGFAYYMIIEDDKVTDGSWAMTFHQRNDIKPPDLHAADPEFFDKLLARMEDVQRRIG